MAALFGTDGVRGIAGMDLSCDLAFRLGAAIATVIRREKVGEKPSIVIGRDTRISGTMLESSLAAGMCSCGADVVLAGVIPTPGVAFVTRSFGFDAGAVVSASHNSVEYNGIKFFSNFGYKLSDTQEDHIEACVLGEETLGYVSHFDVGTIKTRDFSEEYAAHIAEAFGNTDFSGIHAICDCANGAASNIAKKLFAKLGINADFIFSAPNGRNINDNCGSTHMKILQNAVVDCAYDIGIAFDGDADRCLFSDETGEMIDGDEIIAVCASRLKRQGQLRGGAVAVTKLSNIGFFKCMENLGIDTKITDVGDKYVLEKMLQDGLSIGGEQSGHIIFLDGNTTGDGMLTAVNFLAAMAEEKKSAHGLKSLMTKYPQHMVNVRVENRKKSVVMDDARVKEKVACAEKELGKNGRVLLRPSGTEPLIRVMMEGSELERIQALCDDIAAAVSAAAEI